ncbi:MAG: glycosyltransferase [Gloeomargaritaceae cyanobacterium C42_A2020_066]|nr:glycosyltransferase [Gloeomargaritaceae cyanobacterium C42_A2020_066]
MDITALLWGLGGTAGLAWLGLLLVWGGFWRCDQRLDGTLPDLATWPDVVAIVPARNEADVLPTSLTSLLTQTYPGPLQIVLVDDQSTDGTGRVAQDLAAQAGASHRLQLIPGTPLPAGWSGKLWAMEQGLNWVRARPAGPTYLLLTDADIAHDPDNLRQLVSKAEREHLALVSLMVKLRCQSQWEKLLIPAFVFFFQKLYPFPWVNTPQRRLAAAAGGCILVRHDTLEQAGGLAVLREALIDDCTLAQKIKAQNPRIWLGLTETTFSLRPYDTLDSVWRMVARTAYTQLAYSPWLLVGSVLGMTWLYLLAPAGLWGSLAAGRPALALLFLVTWGLMTLAYLPTVRFYRLSPLWAVTLPLTGFLYTLMTLDSARRHYQGRGGAWKGRVYPAVGKP